MNALHDVERKALLTGVFALLLGAVGFALDREQFLRSWLVGWIFWSGFALGALAVLLLHHLVGGGWGRLALRVLEASVRTLPGMALLFLPLAFGLPDLYAWARPDAVASDPLLAHKTGYLNVPFFLSRAALYFAIWGGMAWLICHWSSSQDGSDDPVFQRRLQALSGPGLVAYALTITFASVDWAMSLEPHWYSSIYAPLVMVGQALSALAFAIVVLAWLSRSGLLAEAGTRQRFHDLGNLLLTFVLLWAYMAFSQYLIIWSGDLPEETSWYTSRARTAWKVVAGALLVFHFAVPFLLLLSRRVKQAVPWLAGVALLVVAMRVVDVFWLVTPSFSPDRVRFHVLDLIALVGIGGVWVAYFLHQLRTHPLLPRLASLPLEASGHGL